MFKRQQKQQQNITSKFKSLFKNLFNGSEIFGGGGGVFFMNHSILT